MNMLLADIVRHTKGVLVYPHAQQEIQIRAIIIDSRTLGDHALFVCIAGNITDGHLHAKSAVDNGALAILAERDPFTDVTAPYNAIPVILVPNTVQALAKLAKAHRKSMSGKVIAITGTAGKTTVKELLWHVLSKGGKTSKSAKNYNNQIGLPLSMLAADTQDEYWIMEVGISQAHDMHELGSILQPDMALILNVGVGHTEGLGEKGVAYHKASLLQHLSEHGEAIVSADYPDLLQEVALITHEKDGHEKDRQEKDRQETCEKACSPSFFSTLSFFTALNETVPYRAKFTGVCEAEQGLFQITLGNQKFTTKAPFCTSFGEENLIAVATIAHRLGISNQTIIDGLSSASLPDQRFSCKESANWCIIDDSYNANPLSCKRSIAAARDMAQNKPLICVMGEMLELGTATADEHRKLGEHLAVAEHIFWIGNQWEHVLQGSINANFSGTILPCKTPEAFIEAYRALSLSHGVILFKGSRSNKLEHFVDAFMAQCKNPSAIAHSLPTAP